jgi:hypothetical protein
MLAGTGTMAQAAVICAATPCVEDTTGNDLTGFFKAFSAAANNQVLSAIFNSDVQELVGADEADTLTVSFLGGCMGPCTSSGETGQVIQVGFNFMGLAAQANRIMQFTGPNDTGISDAVGLWVDNTGNRFAITFASDTDPPTVTLGPPIPISPEPSAVVLVVAGCLLLFTRKLRQHRA